MFRHETAAIYSILVRCLLWNAYGFPVGVASSVMYFRLADDVMFGQAKATQVGHQLKLRFTNRLDPGNNREERNVPVPWSIDNAAPLRTSAMTAARQLACPPPGCTSCSVDRRVNEVTLRWARLVLGWVTAFGGYAVSVYQPNRSTQPCIPPGSQNRVPASAGVKRECRCFCRVADNPV